MRRFKSDHEAIIPDDTLVALWHSDETDTTSGPVDTSYSARYDLNAFPGINQGVELGFFTGTDRGSRLTSGPTMSAGSNGWFRSASAASAHNYLGTDWSMAMWFSTASGSTAALIEYSSVNAPAATADCCPISVLRLANGKVRIFWDQSSGALGKSFDFNCNLNSGTTQPIHLGLSRTTVAYSLSINGKYVESVNVATLGFSPLAIGGGLNGKWEIGASARLGTGSGTSAAFGVNTVRIDDIGVWSAALPPQKFTELYRNGLRSWDERRLYEGNAHKVVGRVLVEDGDGLMVDLSDLYGMNWIKSIEVQESVDEPINSARVDLRRISGQSLNLSPLSTLSQLNQNASAAYEALLELRRKIRIEAATVPSEWTIQGWEYEVMFEGFVDALAWGDDMVTVTAIDKMAILKDAFALDAVPHDYYDLPVLAETHLQTLINENEPTLINDSGATLVFGYLGGFRPQIYTPASSGWNLNYDDTPAGEVNGLLQSVVDQIGWDCRYKWYEPHQDHRLTFSAPPRTLSLEIRRLAADANGFTEMTTRIPHGLTPEQLVTISNTTNYNAANVVVDAVLSGRKVRLRQTAGAAAETTGLCVYGSVYSLPDTQVLEYQELSKNTNDIRNACIVKFARTSDPFVIPAYVTGTSGNPISVDLNGAAEAAAGYAATIGQLKIGQEFTIEDPDPDNGQGTYSIANIVLGVVTSNENLTADITGGGFVDFKSEYLTFQTYTAINTPSISKYGLRASAIYEASGGMIDHANEAKRLSYYVVNDLAEPTADVSIKIRCAPWFELHDVLTLQADKKQRWTTNLPFAIVGLTHHLEQDDSYTSLSLRSSSPTKGTTWIDGMTVAPSRPTTPVTNSLDSTLDLVRGSFKKGLEYTFGKLSSNHPARAINSGRRRLRNNLTEVHLSTEGPNFIPTTATTLVAQFKGTTARIHQDAAGNPLTPGRTYHMRFRERDIFDNVGAFSASTSGVIRFNDVPAAALAYTSNAGFGFRLGSWSPFPLLQTASPGFDNYDNYITPGDDPADNIYPACDSPATGGYWQMPFDGKCDVEARLCMFNTGLIKPIIAVAVGVMRLGSIIPGGSASLPVIQKFTGPTEASPLYSTTSIWKVVTASTGILRVNIAGSVSANSGDYIQIAVWPDPASELLGGGTAIGNHSSITSGLYPANSGDFTSGCTSWAKFTAIQN